MGSYLLTLCLGLVLVKQQCVLSTVQLKQLPELMSCSGEKSDGGKAEKTHCDKGILPVQFSVLI